MTKALQSEGWVICTRETVETSRPSERVLPIKCVPLVVVCSGLISCIERQLRLSLRCRGAQALMKRRISARYLRVFCPIILGNNMDFFNLSNDTYAVDCIGFAAHFWSLSIPQALTYV